MTTRPLRAALVALLPLALAPACSPETRDFPGEGGAGGGTGGAGGTGNDCDACPGGAHAQPTCTDGVCGLACDAGWSDCDAAADGCETPTTDDAANCGGCGVTCALSCSAGVCNDPIQIAAGYDHTCALLAGGGVWCWGRNDAGELGNGLGDGISATPQPVATSGPAVQIDAGGRNDDGMIPYYAHTCAVLADSTVQCWGANSFGELGIGGGGWRSEPATVVSLVGAVQVTTGATHSCAVDRQGTLHCWGDTTYGQVGNGVIAGAVEYSPVGVFDGVQQVSAGRDHSCALTVDGTVYCWGNDMWGKLGLGGSGTQAVPTVVSITGVTQLAVGGEHTCVLKGLEAWCWGNGYQGQLGIENEFDWNETPTVASAVADVRFVAAGDQHSGAITGDTGDAWMWSSTVPLGNGMANGDYVPVDIGMQDVAQLALGRGHSCALKTTGEILCWGDNTYGQLGNGAAGGEQLEPVAVAWPAMP